MVSYQLQLNCEQWVLYNVHKPLKISEATMNYIPLPENSYILKKDLNFYDSWQEECYVTLK